MNNAKQIATEIAATANLAAVISALKSAHADALSRPSEHWWSPNTANRWVYQLQSDMAANWRHLVIESGRHDGWLSRGEFIGHVAAVIAFLETHRQVRLAASKAAISGSISDIETSAIVEAQCEDITDGPAKSKKVSRRIRLFKA